MAEKKTNINGYGYGINNSNNKCEKPLMIHDIYRIVFL